MAIKIDQNIMIEAPVEKVRSHILDFHLWKGWSPWSVIDPDQKCNISGEPGALNSQMSWEGKFTGSGVITLTASDDHSLSYKLQFQKPRQLITDTSFHFSSLNGKTKLTWKMEFKLPFFLFFMFKFIQSARSMDFSRGLIMIKDLVETGSVNAKTVYQGIVDFEGFSYVGRKRTSSLKDLPKGMAEDFQRIMEDCQRLGKKFQHCAAVYTKQNITKWEMTYISAVSDENLQGVQMDSDYVQGKIPTQKMLEIKHHGSYKFLGNAWFMGMAAVHTQKIKGNGPPFEYYHNDPRTTAESDLLTSIYFPIKR